MDLLNMTNRAQIHEFYKKVNICCLYFLHVTVCMICWLRGMEVKEKIQNRDTMCEYHYINKY